MVSKLMPSEPAQGDFHTTEKKNSKERNKKWKPKQPACNSMVIINNKLLGSAAYMLKPTFK